MKVQVFMNYDQEIVGEVESLVELLDGKQFGSHESAIFSEISVSEANPDGFPYVVRIRPRDIRSFAVLEE